MTQDPGRHAGDPVDDKTQQFNPFRDETQQAQPAEVTLHEEQAHTGTEVTEAGRVRVRKHVETYPVTETVPRNVEHADTSERVAAVEGDSGEVETLEDGSVSIPVFEEVLVVTKRLVVRERVIVRKKTVVDEYTLQTELRREHATVEGDIEVPEREGTYGTGETHVTGEPGVTDETADRPDQRPL
jgi:uncharacterized protein (TIGR02271 family)